MKSLALAAFVATLRPALALPSVVAKALPDACSSYPGYNADTRQAGPWILKVVDSENAAIEGFGNTDVYSIAYNPRTDPKPSIRWGSITIPTQGDIAKTPLECSNNTLLARVATDLTAAGAPTNVQWVPLVLSPYPYDAALMYKIDGEAPGVFEHYIDDVKQDGVYLGGYDNTTTWGFTYYPADVGSSGQSYYYMRLLGPDAGALGANETRAFVKIWA